MLKSTGYCDFYIYNLLRLFRGIFYIFNNKKAIFFLINELKMKKLYTAEMQPLFHQAFTFTGLKVSRLLL